MVRFFAPLAALLALALCLVPAATARAATPKLAIPHVETLGVETELGSLLTRLLREEVERLGRYQSIGTPRLALREMMSAVDCSNDSPSCLAAVGRELRVQKLVLGKLDRGGNRYLVTLQLFDVPNERVDLRLQKAVVGRDALVAEFPRMVRRFLGLRESEAGTLEVTASEPGVQILVDGVEQGTAPVRLTRVAVGEYRIEARKAGFPPFKTVARVEQDRTAQVGVVLGGTSSAAAPPAGSGTPPAGPRRMVRWYTWTLLGVGVAGLAAGGALAVLENKKQSDFNQRVGVLRTGQDYDDLKNVSNQGKSFALGANIAFGAGGGALLAGAILLWRDLAGWGSGESRAASPTSARPATARPFATLAPGGGTAGLIIEH